jgi:hypothetical protein
VTSSIPLGRILGIRIGINWSWLVVFAPIAWTLASGIFPDTNPGLRHGTYVWMAIVASTLFFASLLLHELGHAVQARREGMEIEGITLWLFGGVAKFRGMFPSAGAEFRIAIAGPLVSLALGLLFALGALAVSTREALDDVAAWLHQPDAARLQHVACIAARRRPRVALGALAYARELPLGGAHRRLGRARFRHLVHRGRRLPVPPSGSLQRCVARLHRLVPVPPATALSTLHRVEPR